MTPIRILFPFEGDTVLAGSALSALGLAAALDPARHDVRIVTHSTLGPVGEHARTLGLPVDVLDDVPLTGPGRRPKAGDIGVAGYATQAVPGMIRTLRRLRPDIVHTNDGRIHANWALPVRVTGCRHLWHHRQDPDAFGINRLAPIFADHIVSVSHFSRPRRPIRSVDHKLTVLRSPFTFVEPRPDRAAAAAEIRGELGLPPDAAILGYLGTLKPRKRPVHFVEAVRAVQDRLPERPVHGLLFGVHDDDPNGLGAAARKRAGDLGLGDRIHLMGYRRPIEPWIAGLDVKLVTALNEPFGRTLIESMYLGTPVVATRHGGNVEAIEHDVTGFLVDPDPPEAFADPVVQLLRDPSVHSRIAAAAHADAVGTYGTERHVTGIGDLYDRLARTIRRDRRAGGGGSDTTAARQHEG